jgi:F-type H+-transporting ATPase subunit b
MNLITPDLGLLFWQFVVFLLLVFLLAKFAWRPILAGLREREESIENALRQADQAKLEMQALKAGNEKLLAEARQERDRILKEAGAMSEQLIEQAKQKATDEGARMIMQAREAIQNEKNAALAEVKHGRAALHRHCRAHPAPRAVRCLRSEGVGQQLPERGKTELVASMEY